MEEKKVKREGNVYEKIMNVQQGIKTVVKSGYNSFHKYAFATERDVIAEIKPLLGREGLAVTHSVVSEGAVNDITKLVVMFRITNVAKPDDFVESQAIGYGQDKSDKGVPKAYTMALKYFFSKMFLVETGDDAEHGKEVVKGSSAGNTVPAPTETTEQKFERAKLMIKESRNVDGLMDFLGQVRASKNFTAAQKGQLNTLINARVDSLTNSQ